MDVFSMELGIQLSFVKTSEFSTPLIKVEQHRTKVMY
jgi:hypothetical protein